LSFRRESFASAVSYGMTKRDTKGSYGMTNQ
jgi:hypothetical protein